MIELEEMRSTWTKVQVPTYSKEELESIYGIKKSKVLRVFRTSLKTDLFIALILSIGFAITLQWLDFSTSNFWSLIIGFISVQHIIIFGLQSYLIQKSAQLTNNIKESIEGSIKKLKVLQMYYRILPVLLTISLFITYHLLFGVPLSFLGLLASGIGLALLVYAISEFLSSKIVRSRIIELDLLREELIKRA